MGPQQPGQPEGRVEVAGERVQRRTRRAAERAAPQIEAKVLEVLGIAVARRA